MTPEIHFSIVGEVDFGKSTLLGRLLMESEALPLAKIKEVEKFCQDKGKEFEPAYLLDAFETERENEFTLDYTMAMYQWKNKLYRVYDTPGHKEFMHKMLSGSLEAPWFILLVDVGRDLTEDNLRHCQLLSKLGVKNCGVVINKMDLVENSAAVFEAKKIWVENLLATFGLKPDFTLPISAKYGNGISELLQKIEEFCPSADKDFDSLSSIAKSCWIQGVGKNKTAWASEELSDLDSGAPSANFYLLKKNGQVLPTEIQKAEKLTFSLSENNFQRGELLTSQKDLFTYSKTFWASCIFWREPDWNNLSTEFVHGKCSAQILKNSTNDNFKIVLQNPLWITQVQRPNSYGRFLITDRMGPCGGGIILNG